MAGIDYLDGGGQDYDWRDWIQEERNLDQPNYEPPRVEPVPDPAPVAQSRMTADPDPTPPPAPAPAPSNNNGGGGWSPPANNPHAEAPGVNEMIDRDRGSWEARLRASGGNLFDQSDLDGIIRQVSYAQNVGKDPDQFLREAESRYAQRRGPTASGGGTGGDADKNGDGLIDAGWNRGAGGQWTFGGGTGGGPITPAGGEGDIAFWNSRGITAAQIFDPATGQLRPGWRRTAKGYAFGGGTTTTTPPPNNGTTVHRGPGLLPPANAPQNYQRPDVNVPQQFSDAITKWIEQFAQMRAQELENPKPNSGQALLEQILREVSQDFRGGGYTQHEQEIFQTQALDPLERLRQTRKQQVLQTLANRGISPNSGVAMSMLADVDRQFDAQRSEVQRSIAGDGARERTARIQQAVQLLSGLAGTENQRLNEAFQYRSVPLNLADRSFNQAAQVFGMNETSANNAFNRAFQLFNASGNPLTLANPLMQLQQLQQGRQDNWQEALGYLAYILANGGQRAA